MRIQTKSTHGMDRYYYYNDDDRRLSDAKELLFRTLELQQERQRNEALEAELVTVRSKADADREERLNTINHLQQECLDLADEIKMVTERLRQEEKEVARLKDVEGDLQKCCPRGLNLGGFPYQVSGNSREDEDRRVQCRPIRRID